MRPFGGLNKDIVRSKDQGRQTVGGVWRGNGAKRNDLAAWTPEPPTGGEVHTDLIMFCILALIGLPP
jgi:hypothetical protein